MSFDTDVARGKAAEARIADLFSIDFDIQPASDEEDRSGIDLWFTRGGIEIAVQVKADDVGARTGNLFIETVSVVESNKPGWAETPRADVLLYYVAPLVYIIPMRFVRENLARWKRQYSEATTRDERNDGYHTKGLCVPLREFDRCPRRTI